MNIAKININPANITFFLDLCCFNIDVNNIIITANAHGLIESHAAAGIKNAKNQILSIKLSDFTRSVIDSPPADTH
jgi:hypothetical protein